MDHLEMDAALEEHWEAQLLRLGWSKAELADRLDLRPATISDWGRDAPGYAREYIRSMLTLKLSSDFIAARLAPTKGRGKRPVRKA